MGLGRWVIAGCMGAAFGWTACGGDSFTSGAGTGGNASGGSAGAGAAAGDGGNAGSGATASGGAAGTGTAGSGAAGNGGTGTAGGSGNGGAGGVPSEYANCTGPGQCLLVPSNCCGYCSEPKLEDFIPINSSFESAFYGDRCSTIDCPSCITQLPGNFTAICRAGRCERVNVYDDDKLVGCERTEDCQLRWGSQCCEACAPSPDQLIAVAHGTIEQNQCGNGIPCPECPTPGYPSDASAECINQRCAVVYAN
ncbi:MAG: hypothetical protein H6718_28445 [Polyangiaceae bacterium]|nr:hypothetical protein [Myxococcales bacterium]MCB9589377.1 hypothetical protein [Polyangiaceae bacterium]